LCENHNALARPRLQQRPGVRNQRPTHACTHMIHAHTQNTGRTYAHAYTRLCNMYIKIASTASHRASPWVPSSSPHTRLTAQPSYVHLLTHITHTRICSHVCAFTCTLPDPIQAPSFSVSLSQTHTRVRSLCSYVQVRTRTRSHTSTYSHLIRAHPRSYWQCHCCYYCCDGRCCCGPCLPFPDCLLLPLVRCYSCGFGLLKGRGWRCGSRSQNQSL
jgi:hypothetical protein